jgi:hypothetical protein
MISLLPNLKEKGGGLTTLNDSDLFALLSKRHIWLAYFLIWAYTPLPTTNGYKLTAAEANEALPSASFKNTPLWKWFLAASSPHVTPAMALIFWERFFWTYFEAGAQMADFDFLPKKWKDMIHVTCLRTGYALVNPSPTNSLILPQMLIPDNNPNLMNYLYSRLVTWDKNTIFNSGAYLFQPLLLPLDAPEAGLLAEIHVVAQVPSIFAIAFDPNQFDPIAQKPFPPLPEPETADMIATLIPGPKSDSSALFANESNLNMTYILELDKNYQVLLTPQSATWKQNLMAEEEEENSSGNDFNPRSIEDTPFGHLPVLDDIEVWSVQLKSFENDMDECDKREFGVLKNLWKLVDKDVPVSLSCGNTCSGPANIVYTAKLAVPGSPNNGEIIKQSREQFQHLFSAHTAALKSLSSSVVILEDLCRIVIDNSASSVRESQCIFLFFEILPLLINQMIRDTSPLFSRLLKCAMLLGQEVIQNKANRDHMKFFKLVLEGTKRIVPTHPHAILAPTASPRLPLFELFTPTCYIQGEDHSVFVELLYIFVKTPHELSPDEEIALASQFNLVQTLSSLVEHHLDRLFDILELAALRPPLIEFVNMGITAILNRHAHSTSSNVVDLLGDLAIPSPSHQSLNPHQTQQIQQHTANAEIIGKIVRLVLIACPHSPMLGSWDMMKDEWLGPFVIPFITSVLPSSHGAVVSSAVTLTFRVTGLPSFQIQTHFEPLARFFKSLFSNSTPTPLLNSKNRASFMAGFELVVARCHPNLIWLLYLNILTPFFAHNSGSDFSQALDILCGANWVQLDSHFSDPTFTVQLASLPLFHIPLVRTIFSNINWIEYAARTTKSTQLLSEPEKIQIPSKPIHFLSLFCKINLLAPTYIDSKLKKLVMSISKQPTIWYQEGKHLFDWRESNPEDFGSAFRGDTLVSAVRFLGQSQRLTDPAGDFKDNLQLFNDVCRHSGSVEAIEVCLEEIRSALFFYCPSSTSRGAIWHLPMHDNIEFVSGYMIPLTQQYHQIQAEKCTLQPTSNGAPRMIYHQSSYEALVSLLAVSQLSSPSSYQLSKLSFSRSTKTRAPFASTTNASTSTASTSTSTSSPIIDDQSHLHPPVVGRLIDTSVPFSSSSSPSSSVAAHALIDEYNCEATKAADVIRGLIVRFMGTLDSDLCLAVLHVASRAFPTNRHMLAGIWEEALRSYFVQSSFPEQMALAVNATTVPEVNHIKDLLIPCGDMKCPLSMRILLEREKQEWVNLSSPKFTELFGLTIHCIIACIGPQHREFDLMVLWFFVLDCVAHPKFQVTKQSLNQVGILIDYFNRGTGENKGFILNTIYKLIPPGLCS